MNVFVLSRCPYLSARWQCDKHVVKMTLESAQMLSTVIRNSLGITGQTKYLDKEGNEKLRTRSLLLEYGEYDGMWDHERNPHVYWGVHHKHPCTLWTGRSLDNWSWHIEHALELASEFRKRYGKKHKSQKVIEWVSELNPDLHNIGLTRFALAMPDEYKGKSVVESYRRYYINEKRYFAKWKNSTPPIWWIKEVDNELA